MQCTLLSLLLLLLLQNFKQQWTQTAMGAIDMSVLSQMADPMMVAQAQKHPEFYRCIKEISDTPSAEVMSRWLDHPVLGKLVGAMWKTMQVQRSKQQEQQQQMQQYDQQWEEEEQRRQQRGEGGSSSTGAGS
eukprot:GHUV01035273.1.p1 GENE.GHUV01035273.1~~GHUV01035273.1.p1  ORF type:complete len:132 (+),score=47.85 GHUV01035273.1:90-485(+)